jgi:hypothetical protein
VANVFFGKWGGAIRPGALRQAAAILLFACGMLAAFALRAHSTPQAAKESTYTVEYYYKVRWGSADEFWRLFQKNHYPLLKKLQESGRIVELEAESPRYHMPEESRWDYRVTIAWKSFAASADTAGEDALRKQLFPDQDAFQREEQRRFEILLAHWDLPVVERHLGK